MVEVMSKQREVSSGVMQGSGVGLSLSENVFTTWIKLEKADIPHLQLKRNRDGNTHTV